MTQSRGMQRGHPLILHGQCLQWGISKTGAQCRKVGHPALQAGPHQEQRPLRRWRKHQPGFMPHGRQRAAQLAHQWTQATEEATAAPHLHHKCIRRRQAHLRAELERPGGQGLQCTVLPREITRHQVQLGH